MQQDTPTPQLLGVYSRFQRKITFRLYLLVYIYDKAFSFTASRYFAIVDSQLC